MPSAEANGFYGLNPGFSNTVAGDYALAFNSPAVGKGRRLSSTKADLLGRCYADHPTIGAMEPGP
jgi:hypothetical protein